MWPAKLCLSTLEVCVSGSPIGVFSAGDSLGFFWQITSKVGSNESSLIVI